MHLETLTFDRFFGIVRQPDNDGSIANVVFGFVAGDRKIFSAKVPGDPPLRDGATLTLALPRPGAWGQILGWLDHADGRLHLGDPAQGWHWLGLAISLNAMPLALATSVSSTAGRRAAASVAIVGALMIAGLVRRLYQQVRAQRLLAAKRDELRHAGQLAVGQGYVANRIPAQERWKNLALSVALLVYGAVALQANDVVLLGRHGATLHLHDDAARFAVASFVCACAIMLSVVVDHYDRRDNERYYRRFGQVFCVLAYCCMGAALFLEMGGKF